MNFSKKNEKNDIKKKKKINQSMKEISNNISSKKDKNKKILKKIFKFNKKILDIEKKIKEAPLRLLAKIENIKKEKKKENKLIKKNKITEFFKKFILILENINKIILIFPQLKNKNNSEIQGISLIQKSILEIIQKNKIKKIGKVGDKYNQNIHKINNYNKIKKDKNYIIKEIIQVGYIFNQKILKKAIVKI
ncbi:Protein GrpE [Buchnera aphidicola (Chaitophorus sp. 3695)]|uniref:nucleotide exchange factor GrpE n=1 Tax=Buchnera aphidicola TaxID=9 RepID=UPI0034641C22